MTSYMMSPQAQKAWERLGFQWVPPVEVLKRAPARSDSQATKSAHLAEPRKLWFSKYLSGGIAAAMLGEDRVLCARAALEHAWGAFGIRGDLPGLRFDYERNIADGEHYLGEFRWTPGSGLVLVSTGLSVVKTMEVAVHETCHAYQSRKLGGIDIRRVDRDTFSRNERQARHAGESFTSFMERAHDIYDAKLDAPKALSWARQELFGTHTRASWTAPPWMT